MYRDSGTAAMRLKAVPTSTSSALGAGAGVAEGAGGAVGGGGGDARPVGPRRDRTAEAELGDDDAVLITPRARVGEADLILAVLGDDLEVIGGVRAKAHARQHEEGRVRPLLRGDRD